MHLQLKNVSKRYGSRHALDNVSLEVEPGQIVALLGLNGAGKSTMLRCIAGLCAPDAGEILFDQKPFARDDLATRRRFFFLPDEPHFFQTETVLRNLTIMLRLYEADGAGAEERLLALLEEFDLLAAVYAEPFTLSRGQCYKAALVALLAIDPEIWIFDEPFASGLDPLGLAAFRRHAREAAARGRTILYSTQILEAAERFSDRALVLHEGRLRGFNSIELLRANSGHDDSLAGLFQNLRDEAV